MDCLSRSFGSVTSFFLNLFEFASACFVLAVLTAKFDFTEMFLMMHISVYHIEQTVMLHIINWPPELK